MFAVFWNYVTDVRILLNQSRIAVILVYSLISFKMIEELYKYKINNIKNYLVK